jgi:hypothetical protein
VLLAHSITEELPPEDAEDMEIDEEDELLAAVLIKLFLIFLHSIGLIP